MSYSWLSICNVTHGYQSQLSSTSSCWQSASRWSSVDIEQWTLFHSWPSMAQTVRKSVFPSMWMQFPLTAPAQGLTRTSRISFLYHWPDIVSKSLTQSSVHPPRLMPPHQTHTKQTKFCSSSWMKPLPDLCLTPRMSIRVVNAILLKRTGLHCSLVQPTSLQFTDTVPAMILGQWDANMWSSWPMTILMQPLPDGPSGNIHPRCIFKVTAKLDGNRKTAPSCLL